LTDIVSKLVPKKPIFWTKGSQYWMDLRQFIFVVKNRTKNGRKGQFFKLIPLPTLVTAVLFFSKYMTIFILIMISLFLVCIHDKRRKVLSQINHTFHDFFAFTDRQ